MLTLGISGGFDLLQERRTYLIPDTSCHDSAAVLVEDGRVIAGIEEERLNRIKHTNKAPVNAIRFCLQQRGIRLSDLDYVGFYGSEETCNRVLKSIFYGTVDAKPVVTIRQLIHQFLQEGLGEEIADAKLVFINHHLAHALSAFWQSGFAESLVFTCDGAGDALSGSVGAWRRPNCCQLLRTLPVSHSLGFFYDIIIAILGYRITEEYKVMGLAPYGNPLRFRSIFRDICELLPDGNYVIRWELVERIYTIVPPRKRGEPLTQDYIDIAAALQEALEIIVFHVVRFFKASTGASTLCLAGGVAHNSTLNGKILYSGLFKNIFVQPASHDAGCAIGAALFPQISASIPLDLPRISEVYWGTDTPSGEQLSTQLHRWSSILNMEKCADIEMRAAHLVADGNVVGWVQGRSEFGPRALGNRSILADPRPAKNKDIVNQLIKKREAYRPFAPSVLEEYASEYFQMPEARFPFMSFTLRVRPEKRELLGATTHVDGTARVQTVSRAINPSFWKLINCFRQVTGVPVLLNTSFNNNVEPIVDSPEDAITCFLTTGVHYLVIGDYLVSKKSQNITDIFNLSVHLPPYSRLLQERRASCNADWVLSYTIANDYSDQQESISESIYRLLVASGHRPISESLNSGGLTSNSEEMARQLFALWEKRAISLQPCSAYQANSGPASSGLAPSAGHPGRITQRKPFSHDRVRRYWPSMIVAG